jgi:hypothetical protein
MFYRPTACGTYILQEYTSHVLCMHLTGVHFTLNKSQFIVSVLINKHYIKSYNLHTFKHAYLCLEYRYQLEIKSMLNLTAISLY